MYYLNSSHWKILNLAGLDGLLSRDLLGSWQPGYVSHLHISYRNSQGHFIMILVSCIILLKSDGEKYHLPLCWTPEHTVGNSAVIISSGFQLNMAPCDTGDDGQMIFYFIDRKSR